MRSARGEEGGGVAATGGDPPVDARVRRAERAMKAAMAFVGLLLVGSAAVAAVLFLPFDPMTVHAYEPEASTVCQGEALDVFIEYELAGNLDIDRIEAESTWTAVDAPGIEAGQELGGLEGTLAPSPADARIEGVLPRVAPPHAGEWRLRSDIRVRGYAYGLPHVESLRAEAEEPTTVLPTGSPGCAPPNERGTA